MSPEIKRLYTILRVQDQDLSTRFYEKLLRRNPDLYVPGMTEFQLHDFFTLGLMPSSGMIKILGSAVSSQSAIEVGAQCELYLFVADVQSAFHHARLCGATLLSPCMIRNWGDEVCYFSDPDGHIIAFAQQRLNNKTPESISEDDSPPLLEA